MIISPEISSIGSHGAAGCTFLHYVMAKAQSLRRRSWHGRLEHLGEEIIEVIKVTRTLIQRNCCKRNVKLKAANGGRWDGTLASFDQRLGGDCEDMWRTRISDHSLTAFYQVFLHTATRKCLATCGGFHKWGYPQIIHFNVIFPYKPSIWRYSHLWKPPFGNPFFWAKKCHSTRASSSSKAGTSARHR